MTFFIQMSASETSNEDIYLAKMYDGIEYRGFLQEIVEDLAKYADVPVWNGLTDAFHPTQMLADVMTVEEHFGGVRHDRLRDDMLLTQHDIHLWCTIYA